MGGSILDIPFILVIFIICRSMFKPLLSPNEAQKKTMYNRPMQHFLVFQIYSCLTNSFMSSINLDIISRNNIFEITFFSFIIYPIRLLYPMLQQLNHKEFVGNCMMWYLDYELLAIIIPGFSIPLEARYVLLQALHFFRIVTNWLQLEECLPGRR